MEESKKLSILTLLSLGGALFSMHFGAASMIWSMTWGKESGSSVYIAFLGIYITAVFIPLLGYFALAKGGSFLELSRGVSTRFAAIFCNLTILVLGPLFVIPRMSAAAWGAFLQITGYNPGTMIPIIVFSILYYSLVFWFVSSKDNLMDRISKILFPILLIVVVGVVFKGIKNPLSIQGIKMYSKPPFIYGLLEGYATMELPTALLLGGVLINGLKFKGLKGEDLGRHLIIIGIIGTTILAITHFAHMYIGSTTDGIFENLKYSSLYAAVVVELWGTFGGIIFNIGLLFAALSCAVGLTSATSQFYEEFSEGRIEYRKASIFIAIISGIVSVLGLEEIIKLTAPLLKIIYPPAIVLTISYALFSNIRHRKDKLLGMKIGVYIALMIGILEGLMEYLKIVDVESIYISWLITKLPLSDYGLSWVVFSIIGFLIGNILGK
ncbi:MAG TPA: branched-chain amino acid transport system II carrier protein, partial [Tissierellales bacterium]|nr:branched-chain amino acid transport system II carrier protein [Tissierellales bacterium]